MSVTIKTPNDSMWSVALHNLHDRGELTTEQLENCLQRLEISTAKPQFDDMMWT